MFFSTLASQSQFLFCTYTGVLATVLQEETQTNPITEAANAAIAILENFSGIFLPGLPNMHPTLRIGLHTGMVYHPSHSQSFNLMALTDLMFTPDILLP